MRKSVYLPLITALVLVLVSAVACGDDDGGNGRTGLVVNLTAGVDDVHRAALGLAMAESALATGRDVTIFVNVDAVELVTRDLPDTVIFWEFPPIQKMFADILADGGQVLVCRVCLNAAGIPMENLIDGVTLATPDEIFARLDEGAAVISY